MIDAHSEKQPDDHLGHPTFRQSHINEVMISPSILSVRRTPKIPTFARAKNGAQCSSGQWRPNLSSMRARPIFWTDGVAQALWIHMDSKLKVCHSYFGESNGIFDGHELDVYRCIQPIFGENHMNVFVFVGLNVFRFVVGPCWTCPKGSATDPLR